MTLHEVSSQEQFEAYYQSNNLQTVEDKINCLKTDMKIRAIWHDDDETSDDILAGLEESALLGYWKASFGNAG